ncbi:MAG: hypothetical protein MPK31_08895 [Gammaproteobacteria bacterium]|nr:hypothetical protein [Gammaproteobacteria bacterium]MDA8002602.1 hypothetical protein [Alphaproteobacteria bacterium]
MKKVNDIYSLEFAKRLIEAAEGLLAHARGKSEGDRAILYLARLSCEISLKAALQKSGYAGCEIKKYGHKKSELLRAVCNCEITGTTRKATILRSKEVSAEGGASTTVGALLDDDDADRRSDYPSGVRYAGVVTDYPPEAMLNCAEVVNEWCQKTNLSRREAGPEKNRK